MSIPTEQMSKLTATDSNAKAGFGTSVAVSDDGETAIIGAASDDTQNGRGAGSAYIVSQARDGDTWRQQAKLIPNDGDFADHFGHSVALSADGITAIIGAWADEDPNGTFAGSAYVFSKGGEGDGWHQRAKLASDDGTKQDFFGWSVGLSADGTTAIIGANGDDNPNGEKAGAAYVFSQADGSWRQQAKLTAADENAKDAFGYSVALSGDEIAALISTFQTDREGAESGSTYVFM